MKRRTRTVVTMAASLMISGLALAQDRTGNAGQPGQPGRTGQPGAYGQPGQTDTGMRQSDGQFEQYLRSWSQDPKTAADKLFVWHAAMGNQMEIELARQAQQKAKNQEVKQVAQRIMQDHQRANEQLRQVAQQFDIQLPSSLPAVKQQEIQLFTSLPEDQFEKHYIAMMQADHAKAIVKYRAVAELSQNDQVKQYARQQLPTLSQHSEHVNQAAVALGLPSSSEAVPAAGHIPGQGTDPSDRRIGPSDANPGAPRNNVNDRSSPR